MFYIRADANPIIATGHVMRCMSIAEELKKRGIETTFITADHFPDSLIHDRGYETICLQTKWDHLEDELEYLKKLILQMGMKQLLVDTYYATDGYLEELQGITNVIYMDDLGVVKSPVSTLINYNLYSSSMNYEEQCNNGITQCLLGPKYIPLREEFQRVVPIFREQVHKVLISTGGSDSFNVAGSLVKRIIAVEQWKNIEFHIISGKLNKNLPVLIAAETNSSNIVIHQDVRKMSEIMTQCDVAVSACGSTMYELCACGLPIITFLFADNQKPAVARFSEEQLAINCGDCRDGMEPVIDRICDALDQLITQTILRKTMSKDAKKVVDGKGVIRLADEIVK